MERFKQLRMKLPVLLGTPLGLVLVFCTLVGVVQLLIMAVAQDFMVPAYVSAAAWDYIDAVMLAGVVGPILYLLVFQKMQRDLLVEQALQELPPDGDGAAWVTELRSRARVVLLENLSAPMPVGLLTPPANTPLTPTQLAPQPKPATLSSSIGPLAGDPAPDFSLKAADGTTLRLSDLHGQPVLLYFLASWCNPCTTELPMLQAVSADGVATVAISVREPQDTVSAFVNEAKLEIPMLLDQDGQVSDLYQVHGLPTSLILDRQGMIVARHVGPLDQKTLNGYLAHVLAP